MLDNMTITMSTYIDAAKSGYHAYQALRRVCGDEHEIHYIISGNYPQDMVDIYKRTDILWSKGDSLPYTENGMYYLTDFVGKRPVARFKDLKIKPDAKVIATVSGSNFRRKIDGFPKCYAFVPLSRFIKSTDLMSTITPDLNYPELNGVWFPHAFDVSAVENTWRPRNGEMLITAYLGHRDSKGSNKYLVPVVEKLKEEGYKIDLRVCRKMPKKDFIKLKSESNIYFDEITTIGVYGRSGVEAMAYGIPTVVSITDTARKQATPFTNYGEPCLKAYDHESLRKLIIDIYEERMDLEAISKATRKYAEDIHSYEAVGCHIKNTMERLYAGEYNSRNN